MHFIPTALFVISLIFFGCEPAHNHAEATENSPEDLANRGAYLVEIMGCNDCHTPKIMTSQGPAPDKSRLLSGHPAEEVIATVNDTNLLKSFALFNGSLTAAIGPWGTSYSANLTPDETGLANWTFDQFEKAMRQGKSKGMDNNRMLLPPMPWMNYVHLEDEDLKAVWAYLQSIPPVKNVVPAPIPPVI